MFKFAINTNKFLNKVIFAYHHTYYRGFNIEGNLDFINILKNIYNKTNTNILYAAQREVENILQEDLPLIIEERALTDCVVISVPRSKAERKYFSSQLLFKKAISNVAKAFSFTTDGTNAIIRHTDTKTTHISKSITWKTADGEKVSNEGLLPYPGIIEETCYIDRSLIQDKNIILIDDIYTKTINIDEDCIQALLNNGAKKIIFYAIALTKRN